MANVTVRSWQVQPLSVRRSSSLQSFHGGPYLLTASSSGRAMRRFQLSVRGKMFVPETGGQTPEARAATTLLNYFTYLAVQIVLAQLEDYNPEGYKELREFVDRTPLKDGDKFCAALMRESSRHKGLAMRILEVRSAYASEDFEWDNVQKLAIKNQTRN
ncbi:hypothetical protein KP509_05G082800 [Ceratopteris richardii]|uniref:Chaperonin-like RBCX protein 1, chloroplastic n=1 Tax=Ceratopteris richardii TaxID=49495 RepID=A0A8T2UND7_CERRI|nr:hypothetical protein KP509_05G082800 [Ceratopteris richardii]